jgi:type VI protein secretion system component Hcp
VCASFDAYLLLYKNGGQEVGTDAAHSWVKVLGFEQGVGNPVDVSATSGGASVGKAVASAVTLKIAPDGSIAEMLKGVATGSVYDLTLHFVRPGEKTNTFISMEFESVLFSSVSFSGSSEDDTACVDITLQYGKLVFTKSEFGETGEVSSTLSNSMDFILNLHTNPTSAQSITIGDYSDGGVPPADNDNDDDGMPNAWEETYSLNANSSSDANSDNDNDGFTNLQEYVAGTNPIAANSFFKVEITKQPTSPETPSMRLSWSSVSGRKYIVLASPRLGDFQQIHAVTATSSGVLTFTPSTSDGPFFKVRVSE